MFELDGFVAFDFNVGVPSASITPNGVTFNRSVVIKMNYPEHVVLMVNKETKQIAIKACTAETQRAVTFYKQQAENKAIQSVRWNNRDLLNCLSEMMDWDLKKVSHRVEGKLLPEANIMLFDLTKATDMK